jgi:membrane protein
MHGQRFVARAIVQPTPARRGRTPVVADSRRMRAVQSAWAITKAIVGGYFSDQVPRLAAALSYYTVFSIAPLLIIATAIAGLIFGREAAQGQIVDQIGGLVGKDGAEAIENLVKGASREGSGILATVIGFGVLAVGASGVFGELQTSLNQIWGVKAKAGSGILALLRARFLSFSMVLGTGFLLLVSLLISAGLAALGAWLGARWPEAKVAVHWLNVGISFTVVAVLFGLIYRFLPDVRLRWRHVAIGACATAAMFTLGKWLIGLYLGRTAAGSAAGAVGSLVVLLIWIYYSSQVFFIGAEFTKVFAARHHPLETTGIAEPKPGATAVTGPVRAG